MVPFKELEHRRFRALITELEGMRGRHTELVTVYIPVGFNIQKVVDQIKNEKSTAQNIKSKSTRKNVMAALDKILQHLKLFKQTPKNGLAVFSGNVSEQEGVADIELWSLEPPEPIKTRLYRCDQEFILDPLKEIVREKEVYGLIVLDKSEAEIGLLKGKKIESLKHMDSIVPGKSKAGGWSQARFARIREGLLHDFLKEIGSIASAQFKGLKDLKGIIIGGPGPVKEDFAKAEFLDHEVKDKLIGVVNTSYSGPHGLKEMVDRSEDILKEASITMEKKILEKFFSELKKDTGLAAYGLHDVVETLKAGNVETLLVSEAFDWVETSFECSCGNKEKKTVRREQIETQKCQKCGKKLKPAKEKDITDDIFKLAESMGTSIELISAETAEGEQLKELGGIAGILRYRS